MKRFTMANVSLEHVSWAVTFQGARGASLASQRLRTARSQVWATLCGDSRGPHALGSSSLPSGGLVCSGKARAHLSAGVPVAAL